MRRRSVSSWFEQVRPGLCVRRWALVLAACAGAGLATGCASAPAKSADPAESRVEPGTYLPDFDRAWELVRDTFHDKDYNGVDWEAVRAELRPRAEAATTRSENRAIINEMVGRLEQSHFGVIPRELRETGDEDGGEKQTKPAEIATGETGGTVGLDLRVSDGRAVVVSVRPDGPAARAGVRPGWVLTRIGSTDLGPIIARFEESVGGRTGRLYAWQTIAGRLGGRVGSEVQLGFLDGSDRRVRRTVERTAAEGQSITFGNLPPVNVLIESRWLTPEETGDAGVRIGYISFNSFMIAITPAFERAMVEFKDADGIVIDLRGNLGGVAPMSASLSRFFVTERSRIGTMLMRGQELQFNADPVVVTAKGERLEPFTGPLAILIDEGSASTAEFMAGGLRGLGRARTFGTRTAGMALPAAMTELPSGDVLLHAIADYINSDGTRLEADGVPPDEEIAVDRDALLRGRDPALRAAAAWIADAGEDV